jgi:hypothetical protein
MAPRCVLVVHGLGLQALGDDLVETAQHAASCFSQGLRIDLDD